jgi:tetratricopeptide (TPR) repeat protein
MDQYKALINEFDFKSREIFNNMGVIRYWQAMALAGENEIRFIYPIEIDLESRITSVSARGLDAAAIAKFREARDYFEKAISHDNEYWTAYINQACIYSILKDDLYMARSRCKAVIENAENKVDVQNAKLILALIEMQDEEGDKDKASRTISELSEGGNEYAVLNQSILNGSSWSEIVFTGPLNPTEAEDENDGVTNKRTIESISGLKGMREHLKLQGSVPSDTVIYGNPRQELITFYYDQAKVLQNEYKLFITTNPGYTDTTSLGIKVGSTDKELKEKYGLPIVILSAAGGWVYNYPKSKMMVVLDQDKRVRKWIIYPEL